MGADLFGSFAESTCAALVILSGVLVESNSGSIYYPLIVSSLGLIVCLFTSFFATNIMLVDKVEKIEKTLKY